MLRATPRLRAGPGTLPPSPRTGRAPCRVSMTECTAACRSVPPTAVTRATCRSVPPTAVTRATCRSVPPTAVTLLPFLGATCRNAPRARPCRSARHTARHTHRHTARHTHSPATAYPTASLRRLAAALRCRCDWQRHLRDWLVAGSGTPRPAASVCPLAAASAAVTWAVT